jgi:ElaB/YqjD/DUF883 family membrane-anchored ribosome-binding protein
MADTAETMAKTRETRLGGDDVKADVAALRGDIEKLTKDMAGLARRRVEAGVESTARIRDAVGGHVSAFAEQSRDYVRQNPLGACATAAAAGFAAALLLRR